VKGWLIDTNVVSELRRPVLDKAVELWIDGQPRTSLYLSVVTLMEVRFGAETATAAKRLQLETWIEHTLRPWYGGRIVESGEDVWLEWRRMQDRGRKRGHVFAQPDLVIAAQAKVHELCVVSRDTTHHIAASVAVFNPWRMELTPPGKAARPLATGSLAEVQAALA
jgi:predicted nucleic acid-binding protein